MIRREDYQYLRKLNDFRHFSIEQFDKIVGQMEFRKAKKDHILFLKAIRETSFF
ncbi:transcriptional regulator, Crp/Fnr family [Streptococcus dysgalactiae subsp. equisimilis SK1249]|nr:transcriptional regulator, Crp/Fnr family [Streptococcus dysgalactiae subsp. equisimilis SK1249]BAN94047.1 Crp family transcriptional regulator [Streptococcus dysgalactiae subsp. equisimilis 167]